MSVKTVKGAKILLLAGDGIGPEIVAEAHKVLMALPFEFEIEEALIGGAAIELYDQPLPKDTLLKAQQADLILLGAVGGPKWDALSNHLRPEKGLLQLRSALGLFANLRPAVLYPELVQASSLKPEVVSGLDIMIVRELTGGIYFGEPRGVRTLENGEQQAYNTDVYTESEIKRIARVAFELAQKRDKKLCSVDKANVLEVTQLWRKTVEALSVEYPDVVLSHMYVDNAAMQLVKAPKQFDVIVTGNLFGDILSDEAAMLTGSIGMLPSASLNGSAQGLYEPCHGSAPDIAGQGLANPLATILSLAMGLRYTLGLTDMALMIESAVKKALAQGLRTPDIYEPGLEKVGTVQMGDAVVRELKQLGGSK